MYGHRVGLIVPSSNTTMEMELHRVLPNGVSLHTSRMSLKEVTKEELIKMYASALESARLLKDAQIDLVLYGCTSGSFIGGAQFERDIEKRIEREISTPVITTSSAVIEALKILDAQRVIIVTPYTNEINKMEREFLEANKMEILDIRGMGFVDNTKIGKLEPHEAYKIAKEMFTKEVDAIFISCTNLRTFEIIEPLEKEFGTPVVTSNQASLWLALRNLNVKEKIPRLGQLLTKFVG
ncbi:MAG: aspartate/glutamate racemase family protein [Methanomicrobia archaeon]|nr:aspartate/glutamate racemase family protein [Methanomicrobia archaeon]